MEVYRVEKKEKKIHWKLPFFLLLLGLIVIGSVHLLIYADFAKVKEVTIEGNRALNRNILLSMLESEIIRSAKWRALLGSGNLAFWLGVNQGGITERLPMLASLKINTDLWQQKVALTVKERKLKGVWCLADKNCFVFDEEGVAYMNSPLVEGSLILKVVDGNERAMSLGQSVLPNQVWFNNFMAVIDVLKGEKGGFREVKIRDLEFQEWEVKLSPGLKLIFSLNNVQPDFKEIIGNLRRQLDFNKLEYIDFRIPNKVYYR